MRTISLSTTLCGLLYILRSVLNMDHGSGLSNLISFDPSSAKGHSDSRMTALSDKLKQKTEMFCWAHLQLIVRDFLQSVNMFS